uniref:Uncharacterized protein n=1 Tax=Romanomermis culicivorax TaxID=13658 RepID=A0A915JAT3_ROMCU
MKIAPISGGTSNQAAQQGQLDPNLIKTCHVCSFVGDGQCSDDRKINCSMGYTCYKYDGTYNGQNYVEKGCLAYRYSANGCYVISKSEHEPFVGTKCFCDAANFCNLAPSTRTNGFILIVLLITFTIVLL